MGCGSSKPETSDEAKAADPKPKGAVSTPPAATASSSGASGAPSPAPAKEAAGGRKPAKPKGKKGGRRLGITTDFEDEDDDGKKEFEYRVVPKSDEDRLAILQALSTNFLFKALESALQNQIVDAMEKYDVEAGQVVITQGEPGDYFYVIHSGKYDVKLKQLDNKVVATFEYPNLFGELALMYSSPRAATVEATEAGSLWRVDRTTFRGILLSSAAARLVRFLRSVPVLQKYSEHALTEMAQTLEYRPFKEGAVVSEFATRFFIIREGQVDCVKSNGDKKGEITRTLKAKAFFGERELLSGQGDETYITGKGGCKLLALSKKNFKVQMATLEEPLMDHLKFHTLRDIPLLQDVTADQLSEVVDSFKAERFVKGDYIITQGNVGKKFFILKSGKVDVHVGGKPVAVLGSHSYFGERSLLSDDMTAADIIVQTDEAEVLSLEKSDFDVLLGPLKEIIARQNKIRMVKTVPLLKTLTDMEIEAVAEVMVSCEYEDGEMIVKQGDVGNELYLVKSGEVSVTKNDQPGVELNRLGRGAFFGERALLEDEPRAANITAVGLVQCFSIPRSEFNKHLGSLKEIIAVAAQKMQRNKDEQTVSMKDLSEVAVLGSGAFGLVTLMKHNHSGKTYALKAINKKYVAKTRTQPQLKREVLVLGELDNRFLMRLIKTFRDSRRVYFLTEPLMGGELFTHLADAGTFSEDRARFYAASVLLGLHYLHSKGIVYRDLKLENLLLDAKGYLKIVDFGFAKKVKQSEWTYTLCGTPDYLAPEILKGTGHNHGADYWSLGILLYEMIFGYTPFGSDDDSEICRNILSANLQFGGKVSREGKDLIKKLLNRDCRSRIGMGRAGTKEIFKHPWFGSMDWGKLEKGMLAPPFVPDVQDPMDVSNFDQVDEENMHKEDDGPCADKILDAVFGDF